MMEDERPRIPEFYSGRSIFLTGFSGFMGKLLVEKLLWSCPDIQTIYVLLRSKRNLTSQQRFQKIINSEVYERVRKRNEADLQKIHLLEGDITLDDLGLTQQQISQLSQEVSIVFHGAATVRFDDPFCQTLDINVKGTRNVMELALLLPHLIAFVHISTAYSNCDSWTIDEVVYPPRADWKKTLEIREKLDSSQVNTLVPKYTNHMVNAYVFTKSLGEQIAYEYSDRLPMVIFRPSIVVSTWDEPFSGWSDNLNGPSGLVIGISTGLIRSVLVNFDLHSDFMPADIAIRGLILVAYLRHYKRDDGLQLYNWCSQERTASCRDLIEVSLKMPEVAPSKYLLWRPITSCTESLSSFYVNFYIFQLLPAFFLDLLIRLFGQKPMLWRLQKKVFITMRTLSFFMLNNFQFSNKFALEAEQYILKEDLPEFSYVTQSEPEKLCEFSIAQTNFLLHKYLKQKPEDKPAAIRLYNIMTTLDIAIKMIFWTWIAYKVYTLNLIPRFLNGVLQFLIPH